MEDEKISQQETIQPISKKELRRPINGIGKAMLFQALIQFITVIIIQLFFIIGFVFLYLMQSSASGSGFNLQNFSECAQKLLLHPLVLLISLLASTLLGNIIPYSLFAKKTKISIKSFYRKSNVTLWYIVKMSIITIAAGTVFSNFQYIVDALLRPLNLKSTAPDLLNFNPSSPAIAVLYIITVCIAAPITEEFVFRGVMLNVFKKYGTRFAIITSALLFGLFHANFYQTPYAVVIGLLFAYIAVDTQSIIPTTIIHIINNTISAILSGISYYLPKYGDTISTGFSVIIIAAGIILFILWIKKREKITPDEAQPANISGTKLIFTSWSCIATIVIYLVYTALTIKVIG